MRKPKLRELWEAIKVLFVYGPYTSKFPKEMTVPPDSFRGKPMFDTDECIGCGACSEVCPSNSIEIIYGNSVVPSMNYEVPQKPF